MRQGETGVSLQEQRDAICAYAQRTGLAIGDWFEERETAAKRGRPIFGLMLRRLRKGQSAGIILHKLDRGARNLRDWADLGELLDQGIEVRFAGDSLDMNSRGGRLSADIQAVVAADYIRNLREETRKGFYGRLKQGLYPLPAPVGYGDRGKGQPKEPDPAVAPLVRQAFELYATGQHSIDTLRDELRRRGFQTRNGKKLSRNGVSKMLNNPFYMGLIRLRRTGETFRGIHQPLVSTSLFQRVHEVLTGKVNARVQRHDFVLRRLLSCKHCGYSLVGERQKGRVYYRCHTQDCPLTSVREDVVEGVIMRLWVDLISDQEYSYLESHVARLPEMVAELRRQHGANLGLQKEQLNTRLTRITDAFVDGMIDREAYNRRRNAMLVEERSVADRIAALETEPEQTTERWRHFLELLKRASLAYKYASSEQKREDLRLLTSNRLVDGKKLDISLSFPFNEIATRSENTPSSPDGI